MRCTELHPLLPEYVRQDLSPAAESLVREHLKICSACSGIESRERRLLNSLRQLPLPAMPEDFPARALRQARLRNEAAEPRRWLAPRQLAYAASVLMVCGLSLLWWQEPAAPAGVNVPLGRAQMVTLKIDAPAAFSQVKFEVELPDNVQLQNQPELREFAWNGSLQAGTNVLSLPLVGIMADRGQLVATVKFGKVTKSLRVPLEVGTHS